MDDTHSILNSLINKEVKALYNDNGTTRVVVGILQEVQEKYIVVNDVIIGLGNNFISCIPREGNNVL